MIEARLERSGYHLRPALMTDCDTISERLFLDIDVAKGLTHDVSSPDKAHLCAEYWCAFFAKDSNFLLRTKPGFGLWAICEPDTRGKAGELVGVRGLVPGKDLPDNSAEGFVAIAKDHWHRGLSFESSEVLLRYAFEDLELGAVYTNMWPLLNPASETVQRKLGYEHVERIPVLDSIGADRVASVMDFELHRVSKTNSEDKEQVFEEAGIKLGQLSAEDNLTRATVRRRIMEVVHDRAEREILFAHMEVGHRNPGWATYRLTKEKWATTH